MKIRFTLLSFLFPFALFAQSLLNDNFSTYTTGAMLNGQNGWTNNSSSIGGGGTCSGILCSSLTVVPKAMSYPAFGSSTAAVSLVPDEDAPGKGFAAVSSGSVYASLLLNVSDAGAQGGDVFRLLAGGNFNTASRIQIKKVTGGFIVGIDKSGTSVAFGSNVYALNTDYLLVLKYTFNTASLTDDIVSLYVNPDLSQPENPASALLSVAGGNDVYVLDRLMLPYNNANRPRVYLGGVTITTSWTSQVLPLSNVLNLRLTADGAGKALLLWEVMNSSATEGFTTEQSTDGKQYNSVSYVRCTGDGAYSSAVTLHEGNNYVRLVVKDKDGSPHYTNVLMIKSTSAAVIISLQPNPVRGSRAWLTVNASVAGRAQLQVSDAAGRKTEQVSYFLQAGINTVPVETVALANGFCYLRLILPDGSMVVQKFIKAKK